MNKYSINFQLSTKLQKSIKLQPKLDRELDNLLNTDTIVILTERYGYLKTFNRASQIDK